MRKHYIHGRKEKIEIKKIRNFTNLHENAKFRELWLRNTSQRGKNF